jgi:DNA-binding PadR family transcriptional regulator
MAKEKKTKFVILGFLLNDSLSGYEIREMIEQSTNNFWQESDASIYPTLKLLAKEGLVFSEAVQVGKRKKEIFTITSAGKSAFLEWFKRPPELDWHREEFLLKLFFTDKTTQQQMQQHCRERIEKLKRLHQKYKEVEEHLKRHLPKRAYWLKTLQIGIAHLELDISLLQEQFIGGTHATNNY